MERIVKVLAVTALMTVLMAITVSPAFAQGYSHWWQGGKDGCPKHAGVGYHYGDPDCKKYYS